MKVACVVVTYNRRGVLAHTLEAIAAQERPPDAIYVVDNASHDGTDQFLSSQTTAIAVSMNDNVGYAAGLAAGIEAAWESSSDYFWLMDDDSAPHPDALLRLIAVAEQEASAGIVGLRGGLFRFGMIRHLSGPEALSHLHSPSPGARQVDFTLVDGALLSRQAVEQAGLPRSDFFMMMEDIELSWRIGRAGLSVIVLESELIDRGHLGSSDRTDGGLHWRRYYQSRNHVRWAIESRSLFVVVGCVRRQLGYVAYCLLSPRARRRRIRAHLRGMHDGARGLMGRTVEPGAF